MQEYWPLPGDEDIKKQKEEEAGEFYKKVMAQLANKFPKHIKAQA